MSRLKLDNTEITLRLDMLAYEKIMTAFGSWEDMEKRRDDPKTRISTLMSLAGIFAEASAAYDGRTDKYPHAWIASHVRPFELPGLQVAVELAFAEGMGMETQDRASDTPRDLVLEDLEKKTDAG